MYLEMQFYFNLRDKKYLVQNTTKRFKTMRENSLLEVLKEQKSYKQASNKFLFD